MIYSEEFKAKVKRLYPENKDIHRCVENGSEILGRFLDDGATDSIPVETVLNAKTLVELKMIATNLQEKKKLYIEWNNMYIRQCKLI